MPIRIIIADDHALLRQGIKNVLGLEPDFDVVGEAENGEETLEKASNLNPDVIILDMNMPRMNGLEVVRHLRGNRQITSKIIILTINDDETYVKEIVGAGADGYLLKDIEPSMLVKAIRIVYEGGSFIYPTLAKKLFDELSNREAIKHESAERLYQRKEERLTYREVEVLQLVAQGLSNQEIAQKLFLSEKTVKNHLTNIFRKISVADRTQAVLYAIKHKIVVLE